VAGPPVHARSESQQGVSADALLWHSVKLPASSYLCPGIPHFSLMRSFECLESRWLEEGGGGLLSIQGRKKRW
jgi:hypothetical protein